MPQKLYQEKTGSDPSTKVNVESAYKSLDIYGSGRGIDKFGTTSSKTSVTANGEGECHTEMFTIEFFFYNLSSLSPVGHKATTIFRHKVLSLTEA